MHNKNINISASEINKFIYCPYQWYYERFYGRKKILEILNKHKEKRIKPKKNVLDVNKNNFLRGNKFHMTFRKKYLVARRKKIFLFLLVLSMILLGLFFGREKFVVLVGFILLIKIVFVHDIKKMAIKLPFWPWILIYSDERDKNQKNIFKSKLLFDKNNKLSGKPDLIYRNIFTKSIMPIELKSGNIGAKKKPRMGDLFQVIAYFIILESYFKKKPSHGYLIYSDYMFKIPNKRMLRKKVLNALKNMRLILSNGHIPDFISHEKNSQICKNCICRDSVCRL